MKIRNGFVSNSSSSSFIINGVKITSEVAEKICDKYSYTQLDKMKISIEDNRYYFGDDESDGSIIGVSNQVLDDGDILELKQLTNEQKQEIVDILKTEFDIDINIIDIKTYIQYISNDNY